MGDDILVWVTDHVAGWSGFLCNYRLHNGAWMFLVFSYEGDYISKNPMVAGHFESMEKALEGIIHYEGCLDCNPLVNRSYRFVPSVDIQHLMNQLKIGK